MYFGMDNKIKTPYSYTLDFSVGRDLGHNFSHGRFLRGTSVAPVAVAGGCCCTSGLSGSKNRD